jgi:hypothetical protein
MAQPDSAPAKQETPAAARLTGRGAVVGMAVLFPAGLLTASWLGLTVLAGLSFVVGCVLAARYTRPADLLIVALTPPVLFAAALIFVEAVTAQGSLLLSVVAGSVVALASLALWLAAGTVLTVLIAWRRGLPQCVRDLRRDLRAAQSARAQRARAQPVRRGPPTGGPPTGRPATDGPATGGPAVPAAARAAARTASAPEPPRRLPPR